MQKVCKGDVLPLDRNFLSSSPTKKVVDAVYQLIRRPLCHMTPIA